MEIDTANLVPGMVLKRDVVGKSSKPIVEKGTKLTEVHIEFIEKFLIEKVSISPLSNKEIKDMQHLVIENEKNQLFIDHYNDVVLKYKRLFAAWRNNVPIDMYKVRKIFVPIFEKSIKQSLATLTYLTKDRPKADYIYYKSVAMSSLAIFLANKLNYEKKDWLQIGFAALLSDVGLSKVEEDIINRENNESYKQIQNHPLYSYKIVENVKTLTNSAKRAILQHHERLDGSGYPIKSKNDNIHAYARIIAVCDYYYENNLNDTTGMIKKLEEQSEKLDKNVVTQLINELKEMQ